MSVREQHSERTGTDESGQHDGGLSIIQERAIELLLLGKRDGEVAAAVGVTRQTVCNWRNHNETFRNELNRRRLELWEKAEEKLRNLVDEAIKALQEGLASEDQKLRLRAAVHVLKCVGIYGRSLDPRREIEAAYASANPEEWDLTDVIFPGFSAADEDKGGADHDR